MNTITSKGKKVLIADDDLLLAESLKSIFSSAEAEVKIVSNGGEVEAIVEVWQPDVILLDIMLPEKNGVEITKDLTLADPKICEKIVIMTTLEDNAYLAKAMEYGIKHYVQKNTSTPQYVFDVALRVMNR